MAIGGATRTGEGFSAWAANCGSRRLLIGCWLLDQFTSAAIDEQQHSFRYGARSRAVGDDHDPNHPRQLASSAARASNSKVIEAAPGSICPALRSPR